MRQLQGAEERSRTGAEQSPVSDAVLLRRVQAGEKAAFGQLVDRHIARAYALALRVVRHREDAEDLVQESFLAGLHAIGSFDADRPFWPWLSRIIVNRGVDHIAARDRRTADPLDEAMRDGRARSDRTVESREIMEHFDAALAVMPPRRRLIVEMFEVDGLSVSEIADHTGVLATTVRWHLHQARKTLRAALRNVHTGSAS